MAVMAALFMALGCEGPASPEDGAAGAGSGNYYVDLVPPGGIPVIANHRDGDPGKTEYEIAEAFNKYDAIYLTGETGSSGVAVDVPPGKTLYVAPGSAVTRFTVAAALSKGSLARSAGLGDPAGPGVLVALDGAVLPLSGPSVLGGLLQVNVGGIVGNGGGASITGSGSVMVGGKIAVDSIAVAGEVYVARGDGVHYGVVEADIDTTYLSPATFVPTAEGIINGNSSRSYDDCYAFENAEGDPARTVRVDGAVIGNIRSGGDLRVGENDRVSLLNSFCGYVAGPDYGGAPSDAVLIVYGNAEIAGNVLGSVIAKGAVAVGSKLDNPHRAQVRSAVYSRTGSVVIGKRAAVGDIVAYQGNVTIEAGGAATGVDTYYNDHYAGAVNRGSVTVKGRVGASAGGGNGSGNIASGGAVFVGPYTGGGDFGENGFVGGNVASRRSAVINGVVLGSLDTASYAFDGAETDTQNVIVNGYVGGRVAAGGALVVAEHGYAEGNVNAGSVNGINANGYVGGGAAVYNRHGTGLSVINGLVEGGSFYVGALADVVIAATGRVNAFDSTGVAVDGTLVIEAPGELAVDMISEISSHSVSFTDVHIFAHASSLANGGRLGPPGSGISFTQGIRIYTHIPVAVPTLAVLDTESGMQSGAAVSPEELDERHRALAGSTVIYATVAPPPGLADAPPP
jgi:cytoskeletal protein CcmA (bactofilin family)